MQSLLTYEVGSLAKPEWRGGALGDHPITPAYLADAPPWGAGVGVQAGPLPGVFG